MLHTSLSIDQHLCVTVTVVEKPSFYIHADLKKGTREGIIRTRSAIPYKRIFLLVLYNSFLGLCEQMLKA